MRFEILQSKFERYLRGNANPAEIRQIQTWLSCIPENKPIPFNVREKLKKEIMNEILMSTHNLSFKLKK